MFWTTIHIVDIMLWIIIAASVFYVMFYALVSIFPHKNKLQENMPNKKNKFLVLYPAYNEDRVIINSVKEFIKQDYPRDLIKTVVISDHMTEDTNNCLRELPVTLLTPTFKKSSKAKALQYAIAECDGEYDYIIILDADNVVKPDFISRINAVCNGYKAIQCHRCAKNLDNDIAVLDGVSEEINNTIFRKAHNIIGLSSALIGSGMCFDYKWFKNNVVKLSTAGEDRELEALLLKQGIFIKYFEDIYVYDEKVSNKDNFQRQRLRWMTAQVQCLLSMLPHIPKAISKGNIDYIDKTIQQALIPRSILIALTFIFSVFMLILVPCWSIKWWILFTCLLIAITIATPASMWKRSLVNNLSILPNLVWKMCCNIFRIDRKNKDFIHTSHDK